MNIRLLNHDDTEAFRALRIEAVHESPGAFAESITEVTEKSLADFADHLNSHGRGDFVLGAFDDANRLIGIVGLYRDAHAKKSHKGTLWGMYVTPDRRQLGIGCALVAAAIQQAKNLPDIVYLTLSVATSNKAARRLYESNGFQIYGIEEKAIQVDGVYVDETLMQLLLP